MNFLEFLCILFLGLAAVMIPEYTQEAELQEWFGPDFQDYFRVQAEDAGPVLVVLLLAAVGVVFVAIDWRARGKTVALQNTLWAALLAWLLVAPLGFAVEEHIRSRWSLVACAFFGLGTAYSLMVTFGYLGLATGALLAILSLASHVRLGHFIVEPLGIAVVFVSVYLALREAMTVARISHWPGVTLVDRDSFEFQEKCAFFANSSAPWAHKYNFKQLQVMNLYRVERAGRSPCARPGPVDIHPLFHGTTWQSAKGIVSDGFRLPIRAGMFGRGIYFADCPLKSWQYCSHTLDGPPCFRRGGLILTCMVNLGERRHQTRANLSLRGYNRKGCWAWLTGQRGAYDSVVGVEKENGGCLRLPEYVIYDPEQARVDYIFEVSDRPAPGFRP